MIDYLFVSKCTEIVDLYYPQKKLDLPKNQCVVAITHLNVNCSRIYYVSNQKYNVPGSMSPLKMELIQTTTV